MMFLGVPEGYGEYLITLGIFIFVSISLFIAGIAYLYKNRVITKGSTIPVILGLSLVLIPIFSYVVSMFARSPGYSMVMNYIVLLGGTAILIVVFIVCILLIKSKKKIKAEIEKERENSE